MANDKKIEFPSVKLAFLVDSVSIPGTKINNDKTINSIKYPDIKMTYDGANLLVVLEGKRVLIPSANIRGMELE